jgi:aspartate kinase
MVLRIVQKYGGTSLENRDRVLTAARRMAELALQGHQVVGVVSAQGHTTDALVAAAMELTHLPDQRELDMCLAAGEQISAGLMALAIRSLGCPAVSLTGWQAGLATDGEYGNARILGLRGDRIRRELDRGNVVVVAGFQGLGPENDITTLGRGGSDTSAVALAAFLQADRCQIFTDVDGVYDRDPRRYPQAMRFDRIGYDRMLELIAAGAQVLHDRSVELARDYGIEVEVLSAFTGAPGTVLGP